MRRLLIGGSPDQGRYTASEVNDGACSEKPVHLNFVLNRRPGRKQWTYSIDCKEIECQVKARQSYEQQSGVASYSVGAAFWEVRASKS